uniref:Retrovirus-related Pol polyprotein from transposon TNT 1-94 n=1 Tax=Tanacetum cinerariifolium TaxID=118510 RepID=A0A6L2NVD4_TANCI|nr:retrovirus-related Pol polyprotein from transposon TNT 1-94 [Tanacetum cinerariifolium]
MKFDKTPPPSKTSPLVDDDLDEEEAIKVIKKKNIENDIVDETLEIDEIVNIKEYRNHPLDNVIGNLNQRTLRSQAQNKRTEWVFRNKLDENGIVSRNKARLDITFSICLCARFQEAPKTSHLEAVKCIFRYIKGTTHLGLWYPKGTGIETVVYAESDHVRDYVDQKSTSGGHGDHVFACLCYMLYCIESSTPYNLVFFILKRMEKTRNKPKELLPYGMLLSRLFKHVVFVLSKLAIDNYLSFNHGMHPLTPHYKRKTRLDHGKKRPRESNDSSSSATQDHPFSSLPPDAMIDENNDESSHPNSSSPSQHVSSSSTVVSRVCQNPSHESHILDTFLSETINIQTQQRDAH